MTLRGERKKRLQESERAHSNQRRGSESRHWQIEPGTRQRTAHDWRWLGGNGTTYGRW